MDFILFPSRCLIFIIYVICHPMLCYKALYSEEEECQYYKGVIDADLEFYFYYYEHITTIVLILAFLGFIVWR